MSESTDIGRDDHGFYPPHLERLLDVLAKRVQTVIDANRYAEDHAGVRSRSGTNNLNEAFSHLAALMQDAPELSYDEQLAQITEFEDHLRRSMMESFELVAKHRLGKLKQIGLWDEYYRKAMPLIANGKLVGAPDAEEIRELEIRVRYYLEMGSNRKVVTRTHRRWDAWIEGAEAFTRASEASDELTRKLRQAVGAAQGYRRHRTAVAIGITSIVFTAAGIILAVH